MAGLGGVSDCCCRFYRLQSLWMVRARRTAFHVLGLGPCIGYPAARRSYAALAWRCISRISKAHAPVFSISVDAVTLGNTTAATDATLSHSVSSTCSL